MNDIGEEGGEGGVEKNGRSIVENFLPSLMIGIC